MVRLTQLPERDIIDKLSDAIDFYLWKGIAVARKMPTYTTRTPTPAEHQTQTDFAYINQLAKDIDPFVVSQWRRMATSTPYTWKDLLVRGYISGFPY